MGRKWCKTLISQWRGTHLWAGPLAGPGCWGDFRTIIHRNVNHDQTHVVYPKIPFWGEGGDPRNRPCRPSPEDPPPGRVEGSTDCVWVSVCTWSVLLGLLRVCLLGLVPLSREARGGSTGVSAKHPRPLLAVVFLRHRTRNSSCGGARCPS